MSLCIIVFAGLTLGQSTSSQKTENSEKVSQIGSSSNMVNLPTGKPAFGELLYKLTTRRNMSLEVILRYNGNTTLNARARNDVAPTSWVGLGWELSFGSIICDHKGTKTINDDEYGIILPDGRKCPILSNANGYFLQQFPTWKVVPVLRAGDANYIEGWEVTNTDGIIYRYGNLVRLNPVPDLKATRYVFNRQADQVVGNFGSGTAVLYPYQWDIAEIKDPWGNGFRFKYIPTSENSERTTYVFGGNTWNSTISYTKANRLSEITSTDGKKIQFNIITKNSLEYYDPHQERAEPDSYQEFYEDFALSNVNIFAPNGTIVRSVNLNYESINIFPGRNYEKRLIASINDGLAPKKYSYEKNTNDSYNFGALATINNSSTITSFTYDLKTLNSTGLILKSHLDFEVKDKKILAGVFGRNQAYAITVDSKSPKNPQVTGKYLTETGWKDIDAVVIDPEISLITDFDAYAGPNYFLLKYSTAQKKYIEIHRWNGLNWSDIQKFEYPATGSTTAYGAFFLGNDFFICRDTVDQKLWSFNRCRQTTGVWQWQQSEIGLTGSEKFYFVTPFEEGEFTVSENKFVAVSRYTDTRTIFWYDGVAWNKQALNDGFGVWKTNVQFANDILILLYKDSYYHCYISTFHFDGASWSPITNPSVITGCRSEYIVNGNGFFITPWFDRPCIGWIYDETGKWKEIPNLFGVYDYTQAAICANGDFFAYRDNNWAIRIYQLDRKNKVFNETSLQSGFTADEWTTLGGISAPLTMKLADNFLIVQSTKGYFTAWWNGSIWERGKVLPLENENDFGYRGITLPASSETKTFCVCPDVYNKCVEANTLWKICGPTPQAYLKWTFQGYSKKYGWPKFNYGDPKFEMDQFCDLGVNSTDFTVYMGSNKPGKCGTFTPDSELTTEDPEELGKYVVREEAYCWDQTFTSKNAAALGDIAIIGNIYFRQISIDYSGSYGSGTGTVIDINPVIQNTFAGDPIKTFVVKNKTIQDIASSKTYTSAFNYTESLDQGKRLTFDFVDNFCLFNQVEEVFPGNIGKATYTIINTDPLLMGSIKNTTYYNKSGKIISSKDQTFSSYTDDAGIWPKGAYQTRLEEINEIKNNVVSSTKNIYCKENGEPQQTCTANSDGTTKTVQKTYAFQAVDASHALLYPGLKTANILKPVLQTTVYAGPENAGTITREYWLNITGTSVDDLRPKLASIPDGTSELTNFDCSVSYGNNYGQRVSGYIIAPQTGNYIFWIASDDNSELWLSSDESQANLKMIASVAAWTNQYEWEKYPTTQKSMSKYLVAGKRYFIQALHKQGLSGDNLAVGWQLPDATFERPIPGSRLAPLPTPRNAMSSKITTFNNQLGTSLWEQFQSYIWKTPKTVNGIATTSLPGFNFTMPSAVPAWKLENTIVKYNQYGQVLMTTPPAPGSTTNIRNDIGAPIGSITGAHFDECGVFTGDYDMNEVVGSTTYFDAANGWEKSPSSAVATMPHFGEKSICLNATNGSGPARNFRVDQGDDYIVSAWVKVTSSSGTLALYYTYNNLTGTVVPFVAGPPIQMMRTPAQVGTTTGWQLMKVKIPASTDLTSSNWSGGLVPGIRIWFGTFGATVAYISDIRFYPFKALVSTTYYDSKWQQPIISIDANNNPGQKVIYDDFGRPIEWWEINKTTGALATKIKEKSYYLMGEADNVSFNEGISYKIVSDINNSFCMDIAGPVYQNGQQVHLYSLKTVDDDNQKWKFVPAGNGYYNIVSKGGSSFSMSVPSMTNGTLLTINKTDNNNQKWKVVYTDQANGICKILPKNDPAKAIDIMANVPGSNVDLHIWDGYDVASQRWKIKEVGYENNFDGASPVIDVNTATPWSSDCQGTPVIAIDPSGYSGNCLKVSPAGCECALRPAAVIVEKMKTKRYILWGKYKYPGTADKTINANAIGSDRLANVYIGPVTLSHTEVWSSFQIVLDAPSITNPAFLPISDIFVLLNGNGTYYFDDLSWSEY